MSKIDKKKCSITDPELAALQILNVVKQKMKKILAPFKNNKLVSTYHPGLDRRVGHIKITFKEWLDERRMELL